MITKMQKNYFPILPGLGLSVIVAVIAKLLALIFPTIGGATIAILMGIILGNTYFKQPNLAVGTKFSESRLLEYSVVLLGLTVTFQTISEMGWKGVVYVLCMMTIVISGTYWAKDDLDDGWRKCGLWLFSYRRYRSSYQGR